MEDNIEKLIKSYSIQTEEQFKDYENAAKLVLTCGKKPSKNKTLIIVGGQSGSGKSRLIGISKLELKNNAVIVDFDELRSLHPSYKVVSNKYPEITHKILHPDTENVKNRMLQYLIKNEYNVIYEGALRNTQGFIDFAQDFRDNNYKIKMDIMAVPELESYGSTFLRYAYALLTDQTPRWVEKSAHDGSYEGVINTTKAFIEKGLTDEISVYVRSEDLPRKIYSTQGRQFADAITAIMYGREMGRLKAVESYASKRKMVEDALQAMQPQLLSRLNDWENLYKKEAEHFYVFKKDNNQQLL